jgi:hypothetical protein
VGLGVALAAKTFAGGSCPPHESVALVSTCRGLISSLAVRIGVTAGVVVLLAQVVAAGLARTAETMDRDRNTAREEER